MKICLAQTKSSNGELHQNLQEHLQTIQRVVEWGSDLVVFPELSLTGYEPAWAEKLAREPGDQIFEPLQKIADREHISIAVGMPLRTRKGIAIGMLIFCPDAERLVYAKQILHEDELPYFVAGENQVLLNIKEYKIAFGICYEALQRKHFLRACEAGATVYLASVAKPERGMTKANTHFAKISAEFSIPILMVNAVGFCDDFMAIGQSAFWDENGRQINQLDDRPGVLLIDLTTKVTEKHYFEMVFPSIHPAEQKDLAALVSLFSDAKRALDDQNIFQWTDHYPSKAIIEKDLNAGTLFILKKDQGIIGAITLNEHQDPEYQSVDWKPGAARVLVVHRLVVDPGYQRRGYAKQLMDFAEAYAAANHYDSIRLDTYTKNKVSVEFYKKRKYIVRGKVFFAGRLDPFYCLEKEI